MKKIKIYPFLFIFTLLFSFFYIPIPSVKCANNWDNFIDFVRTNLGFVSVNNGSLSGMSRDDFYDSLYNTPLVWTDNGEDFSFTPANEFTRSEWTNVCKVGSGSDTRFNNFNIQDCLIKSDYIKDNGSGYDLSSFPNLSGSSNTVSPLDGVEVKTNFSDFSASFSELKRYSSVMSAYNNIKDYYLNTYNNLVIIKCNSSNSDDFYYYNFIALEQPYFFGLYKNGSITYYGYFNNGSFHIIDYTPYIQAFKNTSSQSRDIIGRGFSGGYLMKISSDISFDSSVFSVDSSRMNIYQKNFSIWSNHPVVIGSDDTAIQNYYYWLKGSPSGGIYTTSNASDTIYNYEYVNNNNWETAYNNYITDVSNYYSTTENITNEQLTQYIDNSTTITNITNNYITNNGGESGEDDVITNSWLERIYNKILEIIAILKGESVSESGDTYITDNSVKNEIVEYPSSELFPDVPLDNFIDSSEDFTIDLFSSKLSAVISEAIPFCYIGILGRVSETLSSSPTAPYWEIPFVIERLNIHESLVLDLTSSDWNNVHNVWIACFLILFVSFLFYLTYRIVLLVSSLFA